MEALRKHTAVTVLCTALSFPFITNAASISVGFEGSISYVSANADGVAALGDSFSGVYTFNSGTADSDPSIINGSYRGAVTGLSLNVGSAHFDAGNGDITIVDNGFGLNIDGYFLSALSLSGFETGGFAADQFRFNLYLSDGNGAALDNDKLPQSAPDLSAYLNGHALSEAVVELSLVDGGVQTSFVTAQITSISSVPVPAAAWLFGSGLIGLLGVANQKSWRS